MIDAGEPLPSPADERLRRWRLILGGGEADGVGCALAPDFAAMDQALAALYEPTQSPFSRRGGSGSSAPNVARWLGDIRTYFPTSIVQLMQRDAMERFNLTQMLLEPETLQAIEPDVHLVGTLLSLKNVIPGKTKETARIVVRRVVDELLRRLEQKTRAAITGSLNRAARKLRPRHNEIDWKKTIEANLRHYQPEFKSVVPEKLIGYGRKQASFQREIIVCVDQSGSMAPSVVYSSIFGAVMASIPSVRVRFVVFDTAIVDLTEDLKDPVDLLFGTQLGGGTDINRAVGYCQGLVQRPDATIFILITDLCEGGDANSLVRRLAALVGSGVQVITLLALSDQGAPIYDQNLAAQAAAIGIPCFGCTPDQFPDLMAAAIQRQDIHQWAAERDIAVHRA